MQKIFTAFRFALCAVCLLSLVGLRAYGQDRDKGQTNEHPNGIVQDWSRRHLAYPRIGPIKSMIALQNDPRAILSWQEQAREDWHRDRDRHHHRDHDGDNDNDNDNGGPPAGLHRDWSISLGTGTTAPSMYPAKFGFDPSAAVTVANCTTDFIVFPVNVTGGSGQPNIVAFDQLYSGTVGGTGICNRTPVVGDTGVSATTMWSYDVHAAGGQVPTSPTLSLDGTKVAFVESGSGTTAHFHVLAWKSGDGVPANLQTVTSAITINSFSDPLAPVAGSGTASDLPLVPISGTASDTLSSPFVDYVNDFAYVGNDSGTLFRVKNVFCPALSACASGGSPAPSLDTTWGASGALVTGCPGKLTGAVAAGNIFVGCSDGTLLGFTPSGIAIPGSPLTVGTLFGPMGGIVDPPLIDVVNGLLYVVAGNAGSGVGAPAVMVQTGTASFLVPTAVTAFLGAGGHFNLHAPSFNSSYFAGGASALIYEWALDGAGAQIVLYAVGFSGHTMNSGTPPALTNQFPVGGSSPVEFSPTTAFLNGGTDQLFVSGLAAISPNFIENSIAALPATFIGTASEGSGTTGMVVDNSSGSAQASSVYFGVLGSNTAVKLTQNGLN